MRYRAPLVDAQLEFAKVLISYFASKVRAGTPGSRLFVPRKASFGRRDWISLGAAEFLLFFFAAAWQEQ